MMTWEAFTAARPDLGDAGERLLYQFGPGLGFLATVRSDGGPRVHPICPVIAGRRLYVFVVPGSPKRADLLRDGRYALHTYPAPQTDESCSCAGRAVPVTDPGIRAAVCAAARHHVQPDEVLFELGLDRALHTTWTDWGTPAMQPHHERWRASSGLAANARRSSA